MRRTGLSFTILAAGVLAGLAGLSSCGDDQEPVPSPPTYCTWDVEQPLAPGQQTLTGVSAVAPGRVWAVGEGGTILFHDGISWAPQPSGTTNNLRGVSALDVDHVWAVGDGGTILFHDGVSWTPQPSGTANNLRGMAAIDPLHVWAAGDGGTILFHDGVSWTPQPSGTTNTLRGMAALDFHRVWAVGDGGTVLHEHGSWWQETCDPTATLTGVSALPTGNGWGAVAAGDLGLILSKAQSSLEGSVLNVTVNNYLSDPVSLSNAQAPYCVNSYTLPQVPEGGRLVPGQATITADPKGSGFQCAFSDSDMYVSIRPAGGDSIGLLRLNKYPGANWKVWVEDASPDYSISPSQALRNRWSVDIKEIK